MPLGDRTIDATIWTELLDWATEAWRGLLGFENRPAGGIQAVNAGLRSDRSVIGSWNEGRTRRPL
jgi:hypothetical protein